MRNFSEITSFAGTGDGIGILYYTFHFQHTVQYRTNVDVIFPRAKPVYFDVYKKSEGLRVLHIDLRCSIR